MLISISNPVGIFSSKVSACDRCLFRAVCCQPVSSWRNVKAGWVGGLRGEKLFHMFTFSSPKDCMVQQQDSIVWSIPVGVDDYFWSRLITWTLSQNCRFPFIHKDQNGVALTFHAVASCKFQGNYHMHHWISIDVTEVKSYNWWLFVWDPSLVSLCSHSSFCMVSKTAEQTGDRLNSVIILWDLVPQIRRFEEAEFSFSLCSKWDGQC